MDATEHLTLLSYARRCLEQAVRSRARPRVDGTGDYEHAAAAFVTLRAEGRLRGCMGDVSFSQPLPEVIRRMAKAAAVADPRFPPVQPHELTAICIEISKLTEPRIAKLDDIVLGVHGVIVEMDGKRGLLLPQVAKEVACDTLEFVSLACRKAGLSPGAALEPGLRIQIFEAEVFSE